MSDGTVGILVFCVTTVVVSAFCHIYIRRYIIASLAAAIVSNVLFQCFAYIHLGYLDPFFLIALFFGGIYAFIIALIVGIPFLIHQRKTPSGYCKSCRYNLTGNTSGTCPECGKEIQ